MKQVRITIIRGELVNFYNKSTKESKEMTKITYCVELSNTDKVVGHSVFECFKQGNCLKTILPYVMKETMAHINEFATGNGTKWSIARIDNKEL